MKTGSEQVGTIFRPPHLAQERRSRPSECSGTPLFAEAITVHSLYHAFPPAAIHSAHDSREDYQRDTFQN